MQYMNAWWRSWEMCLIKNFLIFLQVRIVCLISLFFKVIFVYFLVFVLRTYLLPARLIVHWLQCNTKWIICRYFHYIVISAGCCSCCYDCMYWVVKKRSLLWSPPKIPNMLDILHLDGIIVLWLKIWSLHLSYMIFFCKIHLPKSTDWFWLAPTTNRADVV